MQCQPFYGRIHEKREEQKENKDVRSFSNMFVLIIVAFALFVFGYAVHNGGKSYDCISL